jgi:hypothetical protein
MQRMGGGSRKAKRGGGNDPRCGCDMRVGWPADLMAQGGGGSCGTMPLRPMSGGGCGCGAGLLPQGGGARKSRKGRKGAGLLFANGGGDACCPGQVLRFANHTGGSLCGDFGCPFKGTGYCDFYAKGGANWNHHYGEPMYLQAKLRGGGMINDIEDVILLINEFLRKYPELQPDQEVSNELFEQMSADAVSVETAFSVINDLLNGPLNAEVQEKKVELYDADAKMDARILQYEEAAGESGMHGGRRKGGYRPTRRNRNALRKYRAGKSIGFTMRASLKAKGLIPRNSRKYRGKKIVSAKYK